MVKTMTTTTKKRGRREGTLAYAGISKEKGKRAGSTQTKRKRRRNESSQRRGKRNCRKRTVLHTIRPYFYVSTHTHTHTRLTPSAHTDTHTDTHTYTHIKQVPTRRRTAIALASPWGFGAPQCVPCIRTGMLVSESEESGRGGGGVEERKAKGKSQRNEKKWGEKMAHYLLKGMVSHVIKLPF